MKLTVRKQIGQTTYPFTFEGETLHDVIMASQQLAFIGVEKCGMPQCASPDLYLRAYITKEPDKYKYVVVTCQTCRAALTLGQRKDDQSYYFRTNEDRSLSWTPYIKKNGDADAQA